ncbi:MAG: hypothetical protein I4O36_05795 [Ralstonia pickettii]|jgi:hypothetical protein|uniref:Uncharacterized protein n=2 Tax=Ralstonia TaxID=48736 RepID=A0AAD2BT64_9RALS|nr:MULTISPECIES: hypothetical protein [Burkholderiaceae]MBR7954538.1 hypothetical protein [Burkholderia cenocepacia]MCL6456294.1 hypothetical protein [Ralstonia pickettii]POH87863.1 hypothetical protein CJ026_013710 [Ralstonia pickettii]CAJ0787153.1 hypothetical protein R77560_01533 [Ralstonia sp. LMG 18095]CAJ0874844.1 hypothetical protein R6138_02058 [Ralstonia sp. LMG 18095]
MTALEFLARLRLLPASTPLSLPHVAAALEMLSTVLGRQPNSDVAQRERWTDEVALAQWLGEPVGTVEGWRLEAAGKQQYLLGAVIDWLDGHMVALMGSEAGTDEDATRIAEACWTSLIPALEVDGHLIGFFRSLHLEMEPQGYVIVYGDDMRALETARLTPEHATNLMAGYRALADFAQQLSTSPNQALAIWHGVQDIVSPHLALQFFLATIGRDYDVAMEIVAGLDNTLLRSRWHLGCWLWELLLNHEFSNLNAGTLLSAFAFAISRGIDINIVKGNKDSLGYPVFNGTAAHLLADTHGDHFRADLHRGFDEQVYKEFLCGLLGRSLDIDLANFGGLTARDIDESVQSKHGRRNPFGKVLNAYMLHDKLADTLPDNKPGKPGKQLI